MNIYGIQKSNLNKQDNKSELLLCKQLTKLGNKYIAVIKKLENKKVRINKKMENIGNSKLLPQPHRTYYEIRLEEINILLINNRKYIIN
jgi:hypothetical protein